MSGRARLGVALAVVLVAGGGCSLVEGGGGSGDAQTVPAPPSVEVGEGGVVLANIAYNPERLTVAVGREVRWVWADNGLGHTVTADDGSFDSGRKTTGEFTRVFTQPGEFSYGCGSPGGTSSSDRDHCVGVTILVYSLAFPVEVELEVALDVAVAAKCS